LEEGVDAQEESLEEQDDNDDEDEGEEGRGWQEGGDLISRAKEFGEENDIIHP
jgi:hypothetical protein